MKRLTIAVLLLIGSQCLAEPIVIYDSGNTNPLSLPISNEKRNQLKQAPAKPASLHYRRLPVVTKVMRPGKVKTRKSKHPYLNFPLFIVGYDQLSLFWLQKHKEKLKKHAAVGIAVNVQTEEQMRLLKVAAGGIEISPVPGSKIAGQLKLAHYPALISSTLIEQ